MSKSRKTSEKSPLVELLLCLFTGIWGGHKFYMGKTGLGVLYLFTCGLFLVGYYVDLIILLIKYVKTLLANKNEQNQRVSNAPVANTPHAEVRPTAPTSRCETNRVAVKLPTRPHTARTYHVTGTAHYTDNILAIGVENDDYSSTKRELIEAGLTDERIWKYEFYPTKARIVQEPDNPYDSNAIKVTVDGVTVGYIKKGSCSHLNKVINEDRILGIDCEIGGGPYKEIIEEYDYDRDRDTYTLNSSENAFFVTLTIYEAEI